MVLQAGQRAGEADHAYALSSWRRHEHAVAGLLFGGSIILLVGLPSALSSGGALHYIDFKPTDGLLDPASKDFATTMAEIRKKLRGYGAEINDDVKKQSR